MSIPGIPGASEPAFRTRDSRWVGLDALIHEACATLTESGCDVSLVAAKATVQIARFVVQEPVERDQDELCIEISRRLRSRKVIMPASRVRQVLTAYAQVIVMLDVLEINEIG